MVRLADFNLHIGCEGGGHAQSRAKNFDDQRITHFDQLHAAAKTDAESFETLHFLIIGRDVADHGANARLESI